MIFFLIFLSVIFVVLFFSVYLLYGLRNKYDDDDDDHNKRFLMQFKFGNSYECPLGLMCITLSLVRDYEVIGSDNEDTTGYLVSTVVMYLLPRALGFNGNCSMYSIQ